MTAGLVIAVPAKGRLQENAEAFFGRAGLALVKPRGVRDYRGTVAGHDDIEIAYLSASEITSQLAAGGRYDGLLTRLGSPRAIPAVGFSAWIERLSASRGRP